MTPFTIGFFALIIILGACTLGMLILSYNGLVNLRNQVDRAWANIDVILEQRHEEIPKLVSVCEQFAAYERGTLDHLLAARKRYTEARTTGGKVHAANEVSASLQGILAIGEAYPQLQSSAQFVQLQSRISALEGQIADRKEMFNETVTNYNVRCNQVPDVFVARLLNYSPMSLYKVQGARLRVPSVQMNLPRAG